MRFTLHVGKSDGSYEPAPTELRFPEPALTDAQKDLITEHTVNVRPVRGRGRRIVQAVLSEAASSWPSGLRCTW